MTDAIRLMAEVVRVHPPSIDPECGSEPYHCGDDNSTCWDKSVHPFWRDHLAAEIDKALGGLTREWGVIIDYPLRPEDGYPGAQVILDSYRLREAAETTKRRQYPEDDYEVRPRWVSGWTPEVTE